MNNLKSLLSQKLTWAFSENKITLKSNDETMLELQKENSSRAVFSLDGKNYIIRNEGFWSGKTIIEKYGKQILVMKRSFLGNRALIEFDNGNHYSSKITNSPLATISFFDKNDKEIFYYKLDATYKPRTILNIIDHSINENELLMLIILGCYSFKEVLIENDNTDLFLLLASA